MTNNDRVRLLVDALRSGEFHQGFGALEYVDYKGVTRNCCLGVACRIAQRNGVRVESHNTSSLHERITDADEDGSSHLYNKVMFYIPDTDDEDANHLPDAVRLWYGFEDVDPMLTSSLDSTWTVMASELNDTKTNDFNDIADAFEKTYLENE